MRAVQRLLRLAVPAIADFALVHVIDRRSVAGIAMAHAEPAGARALRELVRLHRVRLADQGSAVAHVLRTGRALVRRDIRHDADAPANRVSTLYRRLAPQSALVVPIENSTRVIGALSLCYAHSGRRYTSTDIAAGRRLARDIAKLLATSHTSRGSGQQGTTFRRRRQEPAASQARG